MPGKIAKSLRPKAERAAEWCLHHLGLFSCVATRRALRTKYAKVDFFGCDVVGVKSGGRRIWVQVTAGQLQAVQQRRKKLEKYPWHSSDMVMVWQLVERPDPARPARKEWYFRVWEYDPVAREWKNWPAAIRIDPSWFKAYKENLNAHPQS